MNQIEHEGFKNEVETIEQPLGYKLPLALGQWEATEDQLKILFKPVDEDLVEIKWDGTVYVPWMEYARRLRDAFGVSWAMLPDKDPYVKNNDVIWPFWLIIKGDKVAYAVGANKHNPKNKMSWDDSLEAAQSNALMRCCKHIGMFLELWQPEFIRNWKAKYVVNGKKIGTENKPDPNPEPYDPKRNAIDDKKNITNRYASNFEKIIKLLEELGGSSKKGMQAVFTSYCTATNEDGEYKTKVSQLNISEQNDLIEALKEAVNTTKSEETQEELLDV